VYCTYNRGGGVWAKLLTMYPDSWCSDLSSILQDYLRDDYLVDLMLECQDGVRVPAHRLVLGRSSSLLTSWLREVEDQEVTTVILPDVDSKDVISLVEAIYHVEGHSYQQKEQRFGELQWLIKDLKFQSGIGKLQNSNDIASEKLDTIENDEVNKDIKKDFVDNEDDNSNNSRIDTDFCPPSDQIFTQDLKSVDASNETFKIEKLKQSDICPLCSTSKSEHINTDFQVVGSGSELYKCCYCEWTRLTSNNFISHIENHIEKKFTCEICLKGFSHKQTMNKHKKVHQKEVIANYNCDIDGCSYISERKDAIRSHVKRVHHKIKNSESKTTCPKCGKEMNKKFFLNYHSKTCSGNIVFQCDICGKSGFVNKTTLKNHVNSIHIQLKLFDCEHCLSKFSTAMNLSTHRKRMHGVDKKGKISNRKFHCDQCGKIVTSNQKLRKHIMVVHEKKRNFACAYCNKLFSSNSNVMTHEGRVHTGILPYKCDQCDKMFSRKSLLEKHFKVTHIKVILNESLDSLNIF